MIKRSHSSTVVMTRDWLRVLLACLAGTLVGALFDRPGFGMAAGLAGVLFWHLRQLQMLLEWLRNEKQVAAPDAAGIHEELCAEVDRLRERHKKRKKKLAGYLKQFQQATTALPDATLVLGPDNEIQWANAAAAQFLGIHWPQDNNQRLNHLVRSPELLELLEEEGGIHRAIEMPAPKDAERQLGIQIVPYGNKTRLFVARDITRLHRLNQIRSDFVANVSHELRTPLTVFSGYLESMDADRDQAPAHWVPALEQLRGQARRMQQVINELLTLSRLEQDATTTDSDVVAVPGMLNTIVTSAQDLSGDKKHIFRLDIDPQLCLRGSVAELQSAFSNLIFNAVQYTPERGVITVTWNDDGNGPCLAVKDTGIGIAPQHIERLTERFYRVDMSRSRDSGGTGLGLAIVKHVLTRHGARLEVQSTPGEGSVFSCHFPPARAVLEPAEELNKSA